MVPPALRGVDASQRPWVIPCKLESRHVAHAGVSDEPRASASMSTRDGGGPLTVCIVILVSDAVIFLLV